MRERTLPRGVLAAVAVAGSGMRVGRVTAVPRLPWGAWLATDVLEMDEDDLVALARSGDEAAFAAIVEPHRRELLAHAYRMLGSVVEAEDALQETLLAAWRGLPGFAGRSSLRTWLFKIATRACLRLASKHPPRLLSSDYGPARTGLRTSVTRSRARCGWSPSRRTPCPRR